MSRRAHGLNTLLVLFLAFLPACSRQQLGLPRVALEAGSPDGRYTAFVRNHVQLDPPDQSLWLRTPERGAVELGRLGADMDWCNRIVWSEDSSTVAFLVRDARIVVADSASAEVILDRWLAGEPRAYPPEYVVRSLALSTDGSEASFRSCPRQGGPCSATRLFEIAGHRAG